MKIPRRVATGYRDLIDGLRVSLQKHGVTLTEEQAQGLVARATHFLHREDSGPGGERRISPLASAEAVAAVAKWLNEDEAPRPASPEWRR